ncbi:hypothetical protein K8I85_08970 [bacterium]|nr:hypothetical protein [bacterium]
MKNRIALLLPVLVLGLIAAVPAPSLAPDTDADPVGGRNYFFCAAFQIIKYTGMATAQPHAVLAGAIGSGVACAYGW